MLMRMLMQKPSTTLQEDKNQLSLKTIFIKDYHPIWNVAFMSCGIVSCYIFRFPYNSNETTRIVGLCLWSITLLLFILINAFLILKLIHYKNFRTDLITDLKLNLFLAPYSMGFSTIINMITLITNHYKHDNFTIGLIILWFINVCVAIFSSWFILFMIFKSSKVSLSDLNPQIILLALPLSVVASSGSLLTSVSVTHGWQKTRLLMMILTFLLLSNATFLSFVFFDIMILKMLIYKIPPVQLQFSIFPTLGYLGHATWGLSLNFVNLKLYLNEFTGVGEPVVESLHVVAMLCCLYLFSIGFLFTFLGIGINLVYGLPRFSRLYWIIPFPLVAFSLGLNEFHAVFGLGAFKVIGVIYGAVGIVLVGVCLCGSVVYEFPWDGISTWARQ